MFLANIFGRTGILIACLFSSAGITGAVGEAIAFEQGSPTLGNRHAAVLRVALATPNPQGQAAADLSTGPEKGSEAADQQAAGATGEGLNASAEGQTEWSSLLLSVAYVLIATLVLLVSIWLLLWARVAMLRRLEKIVPVSGKAQPVLAVDLRRYVLQAGRAVTRLVAAVAGFMLGYLWLVYSLAQFPYSASWSERLWAFLVDLFLVFWRGALEALPGLIAVVVIILIARWCARLINVVFNELQAGKVSLPWMERETARTTQTLLIVLVWLFALVIAYPYIPGSDTAAFKGLSVLVGLMLTLGSTGLINQIISGLFVTYSKSVRPQEYVKVGDIEGEVLDVGFLATKLRTPRQEEITIPHSVLVGTATTNYSRLAGDHGMVVTVSVTIGYDVPWRQVHALLLLGASRTPGIRKEPPPRVLQRELSDFYVQYHLLAHLEEGKSRAAVLSELHAQIQDAFNEHGTQIMSPHFESQPPKPVLVPRSAWYAPPASFPPSAVTAEPGAVDPKEVEPGEPVSAEPAAKPVPLLGAEKKDRKRPILPRPPRIKPPGV